MLSELGKAIVAVCLGAGLAAGAQDQHRDSPEDASARVVRPVRSAKRSYTKRDYATWIDFDNGRWFTICHLAPPLPPWGHICDQMANRAFRYLVLDDTADRDYYVEKQMALAEESYVDVFVGGKGAHPHGDRIGQALAEVYLAMRHTMTPAQRKKVEKWYHDFAQYTWDNSEHATHQHTRAGFFAVVGYMTGDRAMLDKAREYLSFEDTWTIQEDSRHYAALIMERMFRIEIFTHDFDIPQSSKANLAKQMRWLLSIFPHNGFNPPFGDCWVQNEIDHYMGCLIIASHYLKDYDLELARECKWLAERMFEYGQNRSVPVWTSVHGWYPSLEKTQGSFYDGNQTSAFYNIQANPIYFSSFLDESIVPKEPDINSYGSKVVHRLRVRGNHLRRDRDTDLGSFEYMIDKIVHRDTWGDDALFLLLDPVSVLTVKNHEAGAANAIVSISYAGEEFLTGKIINRYNHQYTQNCVADTPSDSRRNFGTSLDCFADNPDYSRSVTTLEGWQRTVTLYKTGDRRIEVQDYLPKAGTVYWHLQGTPAWEPDKVTLDVRGTQIKVTYSGHDSLSHEDIDTWANANPLQRWGYTGNPDRELKLHRSSPGAITTTFRPIERR